MKNLFKNFPVVAFVALALPVAAQNIGLYPSPLGYGAATTIAQQSTNVVWNVPLTNGVPNAAGVYTTNYYGLPGTSTNVLQSVQDYQYVGFTWSYTLGSNATVSLYKSFDFGVTFEKTPSFSFAGPILTPTAWTTNASLDVHGVTTLAIVVANASTLTLTNNLIELNLQAPRVQVQQAGLQPSTAGPVPGITSTNWTP